MVLVLAKRRQSSADGSLRPRCPHTAQLSSLKESGTQFNRPSCSSGRPKGDRAGLTDCDTGRLPLLLGQRDRDGGKVHYSLRPGPLLGGGLGEGSGVLQDTVPSLVPGPPAHLLTQGQVSGRASGRRLESAPYLTLHLTTTTPLLSDSSHCHSLTVGCL